MNILDFETNFETAAKSFLATDLSAYSDLQLVASLDQGNFTIPRVEINAELQGAEDPSTLDQQDRFNYSQYSMNFILRIISDLSDSSTDASTGLTPAETHRAIRKKVRESMLLSSSNWTTASINSAIVTGAGSSIVNGVYSKTSTPGHAGRYTYEKPSGASYGKIIYTDSNEWEISVEEDGSDVVFYTGTPSGFHPWNVSSWATVSAGGSDPAPTVSQGYILEDYSVKYMRPAGTDFEVDGDLGISTLTYEIKFCTHSSRWDILD